MSIKKKDVDIFHEPNGYQKVGNPKNNYEKIMVKLN